MKSIGSFAVLVGAGLCASACLQPHDKADASGNTVADKPVVAAEKPFAAGGKIDIQLEGGGYEVQAAADDRIRVTLNGNIGNAKVELAADGTHADLKVKDTPNNNFHATIEVPKAADLVIRLSGGDLLMAPITGNKDVEAYGGDIKIGVGDPNDYSSVDASVKAGDINAGVFGGSKSGLLQRFTWSGPGKYTLRASLGAGDLVLRSK
jgi:hypothetical protein